MTASPRKRAAYGALVLTAALWGSNPAVSRLVLERIPPMSLIWLRWAIVLVLLLPFVWTERRAIESVLRDHWKVVLPFALFGFAPQNILVFFGLAGSSALNLSLFNSVIPVLIILIGWGWYGRRPHGLETVGLLLSLVGVLLIIGRGDLLALLRLELNPWDLAMLAGMAVWSLYTIRLKDRPPMLSLVGFVFAAALLGEIITLPVLTLEFATHGLPALDAGTAAALIYIAALPTLLAMVLFGFAVQRVGPVQAGIFTHLVPVFGSVFAATLVGEVLRPYHGVGFVLVAGGAILSCLRQEPVLSSPPAQRS